ALMQQRAAPARATIVGLIRAIAPTEGGVSPLAGAYAIHVRARRILLCLKPVPCAAGGRTGVKQCDRRTRERISCPLPHAGCAATPLPRGPACPPGAPPAIAFGAGSVLVALPSELAIGSLRRLIAGGLASMGTNQFDRRPRRKAMLAQVPIMIRAASMRRRRVLPSSLPSSKSTIRSQPPPDGVGSSGQPQDRAGPERSLMRARWLSRKPRAKLREAGEIPPPREFGLQAAGELAAPLWRGKRLPDRAAHRFERGSRVGNDARHAIEMMDHAAVTGIAHPHSGLRQPLGIGLAFVPQRVQLFRFD